MASPSYSTKRPSSIDISSLDNRPPPPPPGKGKGLMILPRLIRIRDIYKKARAYEVGKDGSALNADKAIILYHKISLFTMRSPEDKKYGGKAASNFAEMWEKKQVP
jgi:hypothetical protein